MSLTSYFHLALLLAAPGVITKNQHSTIVHRFSGEPLEASQSSEFPRFVANRSVDRRVETCSSTNRSDINRWWAATYDGQLSIHAVRISLNPEPIQAFTVFVQKWHQDSRATYQKCGRYYSTQLTDGKSGSHNARQLVDAGNGDAAQPDDGKQNFVVPRMTSNISISGPSYSDRDKEIKETDKQYWVDIKCDEVLQGNGIFIRDDRKTKEYFVICEVELMVQTFLGCEPLVTPKDGSYLVSFNDVSGIAEATFTCDPGYKLTGDRKASCHSRGWSAPAPTCIPTTCRPVPSLQNGQYSLNPSTGDANYRCNSGFILVVNTDDGGTAQQEATISCDLEEGKWRELPFNFTCVDAGHLRVYSTLTVLMISLGAILVLVVLFIGTVVTRMFVNNSRHQQISKPVQEEAISGIRGISILDSSETLRAATVTPSFLRSLSPVCNSFKPFSYTAGSIPALTGPGYQLPCHQDRLTATLPTNLRNHVIEESICDTLLPGFRQQEEHVYEGMPADAENPYDNVTEDHHEPKYMNTKSEQDNSYPDLLEMVNRSDDMPTWTAVTKSQVDPSNKKANPDENSIQKNSNPTPSERPVLHYAQVDISKKRASQVELSSHEFESHEIDIDADQQVRPQDQKLMATNSYAKHLIQKFNALLKEKQDSTNLS